MTDYIRYIFYLNRYQEGNCQRGAGVVRLEKRDLRWHISVVSDMCGRMPLYLIGKREGGYSVKCLGEIPLDGADRIVLDEEAGAFIGKCEGFCGILLGEREDFLAGSGNEPECDLGEAVFGNLATAPSRETNGDACFCQIRPEDLGCFPAEERHLMKNSFLMQGYYSYHHLLLWCRNQQPYIGVPGQFNRRERYLAPRFGFPLFRAAGKEEASPGDFGYWMRKIRDFEGGRGCAILLSQKEKQGEVKHDDG